jgi:hypothetical protein
MTEIAWPLALFLSVCVITGANVYLRKIDKPDPNAELEQKLREIQAKVNALAVKRGLS